MNPAYHESHDWSPVVMEDVREDTDIYDSDSFNKKSFFKWPARSGEISRDFECWSNQGAVSIRKTVLPGMAIPMLKIRRPNGRLIFNMEIAIRR